MIHYCGLIMTHNKNLRGGVANFSGKSFIPSHMHDNQLTHTGYAVREGKFNNAKILISNPPVAVENSEQKVDLLIRKL